MYLLAALVAALCAAGGGVPLPPPDGIMDVVGCPVLDLPYASAAGQPYLLLKSGGAAVTPEACWTWHTPDPSTLNVTLEASPASGSDGEPFVCPAGTSLLARVTVLAELGPARDESGMMEAKVAARSPSGAEYVCTIELRRIAWLQLQVDHNSLLLGSRTHAHVEAQSAEQRGFSSTRGLTFLWSAHTKSSSESDYPSFSPDATRGVWQSDTEADKAITFHRTDDAGPGSPAPASALCRLVQSTLHDTQRRDDGARGHASATEAPLPEGVHSGSHVLLVEGRSAGHFEICVQLPVATVSHVSHDDSGGQLTLLSACTALGVHQHLFTEPMGPFAMSPATQARLRLFARLANGTDQPIPLPSRDFLWMTSNQRVATVGIHHGILDANDDGETKLLVADMHKRTAASQDFTSAATCDDGLARSGNGNSACSGQEIGGFVTSVHVAPPSYFSAWLEPFDILPQYQRAVDGMLGFANPLHLQNMSAHMHTDAGYSMTDGPQYVTPFAQGVLQRTRISNLPTRFSLHPELEHTDELPSDALVTCSHSHDRGCVIQAPAKPLVLTDGTPYLLTAHGVDAQGRRLLFGENVRMNGDWLLCPRTDCPSAADGAQPCDEVLLELTVQERDRSTSTHVLDARNSTHHVQVHSGGCVSVALDGKHIYAMTASFVSPPTSNATSTNSSANASTPLDSSAALLFRPSKVTPFVAARAHSITWHVTPLGMEPRLVAPAHPPPFSHALMSVTLRMQDIVHPTSRSKFVVALPPLVVNFTLSPPVLLAWPPTTRTRPSVSPCRFTRLPRVRVPYDHVNHEELRYRLFATGGHAAAAGFAYRSYPLSSSHSAKRGGLDPSSVPVNISPGGWVTVRGAGEAAVAIQSVPNADNGAALVVTASKVGALKFLVPSYDVRVGAVIAIPIHAHDEHELNYDVCMDLGSVLTWDLLVSKELGKRNVRTPERSSHVVAELLYDGTSDMAPDHPNFEVVQSAIAEAHIPDTACGVAVLRMLSVGSVALRAFYGGITASIGVKVYEPMRVVYPPQELLAAVDSQASVHAMPVAIGSSGMIAVLGGLQTFDACAFETCDSKIMRNIALQHCVTEVKAATRTPTGAAATSDAEDELEGDDTRCSALTNAQLGVESDHVDRQHLAVRHAGVRLVLEDVAAVRMPPNATRLEQGSEYVSIIPLYTYRVYCDAASPTPALLTFVSSFPPHESNPMPMSDETTLHVVCDVPGRMVLSIGRESFAEHGVKLSEHEGSTGAVLADESALVAARFTGVLYPNATLLNVSNTFMGTQPIWSEVNAPVLGASDRAGKHLIIQTEPFAVGWRLSRVKPDGYTTATAHTLMDEFLPEVHLTRREVIKKRVVAADTWFGRESRRGWQMRGAVVQASAKGVQRLGAAAIVKAEHVTRTCSKRHLEALRNRTAGTVDESLATRLEKWCATNATTLTGAMFVEVVAPLTAAPTTQAFHVGTQAPRLHCTGGSGNASLAVYRVFNNGSRDESSPVSATFARHKPRGVPHSADQRELYATVTSYLEAGMYDLTCTDARLGPPAAASRLHLFRVGGLKLRAPSFVAAGARVPVALSLVDERDVTMDQNTSFISRIVLERVSAGAAATSASTALRILRQPGVCAASASVHSGSGVPRMRPSTNCSGITDGIVVANADGEYVLQARATVCAGGKAACYDVTSQLHLVTVYHALSASPERISLVPDASIRLHIAAEQRLSPAGSRAAGAVDREADDTRMVPNTATGFAFEQQQTQQQPGSGATPAPYATVLLRFPSAATFHNLLRHVRFWSNDTSVASVSSDGLVVAGSRAGVAELTVSLRPSAGSTAQHSARMPNDTHHDAYPDTQTAEEEVQSAGTGASATVLIIVSIPSELHVAYDQALPAAPATSTRSADSMHGSPEHGASALPPLAQQSPIDAAAAVKTVRSSEIVIVAGSSRRVSIVTELGHTPLSFSGPAVSHSIQWQVLPDNVVSASGTALNAKYVCPNTLQLAARPDSRAARLSPSPFLPGTPEASGHSIWIVAKERHDEHGYAPHEAIVNVTLQLHTRHYGLVQVHTRLHVVVVPRLSLLRPYPIQRLALHATTLPVVLLPPFASSPIISSLDDAQHWLPPGVRHRLVVRLHSWQAEAAATGALSTDGRGNAAVAAVSYTPDGMLQTAACTNVSAGTQVLHVSEVLESVTGAGGELPTSLRDYPLQSIVYQVRCAPIASMTLVPLHMRQAVRSSAPAAFAAAPADADAREADDESEVSDLAVGSTAMYIVSPADAMGRPFSVGLGSLCLCAGLAHSAPGAQHRAAPVTSAGEACTGDNLGVALYSSDHYVGMPTFLFPSDLGMHAPWLVGDDELLVGVYCVTTGSATVQLSFAPRLFLSHGNDVVNVARSFVPSRSVRGDYVSLTVRNIIHPASNVTMLVGDTIRFTVTTGAPAAGAAVPDRSSTRAQYVWQSSNASVVSVDEATGVALSLAPGVAVISFAHRRAADARTNAEQAPSAPRMLRASTGYAVVRVVDKRALRLSLQPISLDDLVRRASSSAALQDGLDEFAADLEHAAHSLQLSDAPTDVHGQSLPFVTRVTPGSDPHAGGGHIPIVFSVRLQTADGQQLLEPCADGSGGGACAPSSPQLNVTFQCSAATFSSDKERMSEFEWLQAVAVGPGAVNPMFRAHRRAASARAAAAAATLTAVGGMGNGLDSKLPTVSPQPSDEAAEASTPHALSMSLLGQPTRVADVERIVHDYVTRYDSSGRYCVVLTTSWLKQVRPRGVRVAFTTFLPSGMSPHSASLTASMQLTRASASSDEAGPGSPSDVLPARRSAETTYDVMLNGSVNAAFLRRFHVVPAPIMHKLLLKFGSTQDVEALDPTSAGVMEVEFDFNDESGLYNRHARVLNPLHVPGVATTLTSDIVHQDPRHLADTDSVVEADMLIKRPESWVVFTPKHHTWVSFVYGSVFDAVPSAWSRSTPNVATTLGALIVWHGPNLRVVVAALPPGQSDVPSAIVDELSTSQDRMAVAHLLRRACHAYRCPKGIMVVRVHPALLLNATEDASPARPRSFVGEFVNVTHAVTWHHVRMQFAYDDGSGLPAMSPEQAAAAASMWRQDASDMDDMLAGAADVLFSRVLPWVLVAVLMLLTAFLVRSLAQRKSALVAAGSGDTRHRGSSLRGASAFHQRGFGGGSGDSSASESGGSSVGVGTSDRVVARPRVMTADMATQTLTEDDWDTITSSLHQPDTAAQTVAGAAGEGSAVTDARTVAVASASASAASPPPETTDEFLRHVGHRSRGSAENRRAAAAAAAAAAASSVASTVTTAAALPPTSGSASNNSSTSP